jgi:dipeptidyl-peptidase 4
MIMRAAYSILIVLAIANCQLPAQAPKEAAWWQPTEARLKAIYENGDFRPRGFSAEWLPDSSGYVVVETDPETNRSSRRVYDVRTGELAEPQPAEVPSTARSERLSPDGKRRLEYDGRNLIVRDVDSGERTELLTSPPESDIHYRDPKWSPDGSQILFVEADYDNVRQRAVLIPDDPSFPGVEKHRFARVGEAIPRLRVGVVDSAGNDPCWLPIESPEEGYYLGQVDWAGSSDEILVEKFSRFRDQRQFLLVTLSGQVEVIDQETNEAWVESSQGKNSGLTWLQDGDRFIVISERGGWRQAYLGSRTSKELSLLTPGDYDVIERGVVDEERGWYYFYASPDNATQKHLYRVPLDGSGELTRITPEDQAGTHDYKFSPDARWAFHTYSRLDDPPVVELVELPEHRVVRLLEDNRDLRERMQEVISQPTEFLQLDIGDGISLDAWLIKPRDFDESRKYPVLVYVYGEPHAQTVLDEWGTGQIDFHRVIADLGYVVVSIDNRGTPAPKGADWRRSIFGSLGPLSTEEQEAALQELGRRFPYVDLSRVGIWGWSGGGSNTLNALFRKPDSYHVGIAVVPKPQPDLYNAWFQEIFMRTKEVNPEGYQQAAPIHFADGLRGKLLIITGSGETNTHIQIIEGLVDRLIELGKPFDYMVYPNRDHGLREGAGTLVHVRMLIIRYLLEHLAPN